MKKIKIKKLLKKIATIIFGAIIGYLLYYSVFMETIVLFIDSSSIKYTIISILALIISIASCIAVLSLIINQRINKQLFIVICIAYFTTLFTVLFLRSSIERIFIFNPFIGLADTFSNWETALQNVINLVMFIPIGYFMRKLKYHNLLIVSFVISLGIELIQLLTMRGIFDTFDILLYFIGINIGYLLFNKFRLIVE